MKIFINARSHEVADSVSAALSELNADITCCCDDESAESAELSEYDVVIVSTPLRTEFGLNFLADAHRRTRASLICLVKTDIAEEVQERARFTGAFVLPRPFTKAALVQTVRMALLAGENIRRLEDENDRLSQKLSDSRLINRAKCCLIQYLNLTEEQAQQHIVKLSMETRRSKREIAEDILHTYGNTTL